MSYATIERRDNHVAIIRMDREARLNALGVELVDDVVAALNELEADTEVRAVVLAGAGRAFSSGGDLADVGARVAGGEPEARIAVMGALHHLITRAAQQPAADRRRGQRARLRGRLLDRARLRPDRRRGRRPLLPGLRPPQPRPRPRQRLAPAAHRRHPRGEGADAARRGDRRRPRQGARDRQPPGRHRRRRAGRGDRPGRAPGDADPGRDDDGQGPDQPRRGDDARGLAADRGPGAGDRARDRRDPGRDARLPRDKAAR